MAKVRRCRWCRRILDPTAPHVDDSAQRRVRPHCADSHTCDWCEWCYQRRFAAIKAGRADLLDAGPATQELPAVTDGDDIPPDQMT